MRELERLRGICIVAEETPSGAISSSSGSEISYKPKRLYKKELDRGVVIEEIYCKRSKRAAAHGGCCGWLNDSRQ
jgi:hypothetical protein